MQLAPTLPDESPAPPGPCARPDAEARPRCALQIGDSGRAVVEPCQGYPDQRGQSCRLQQGPPRRWVLSRCPRGMHLASRAWARASQRDFPARGVAVPDLCRLQSRAAVPAPACVLWTKDSSGWHGMTFPLRNLAVGAGSRHTGLPRRLGPRALLAWMSPAGRGTRDEALGAGLRSDAEG